MKHCLDCQFSVVRTPSTGLYHQLMCAHKVVPNLFDGTTVPAYKMRTNYKSSYCGSEARLFKSKDDRDEIKYANQLFAEACRAVLLGAFGVIVLSWSIAMLIRWVKGA
ncbi:MAG: hypothetical protein ILNGONEN_00798 [Syntrophorhabdaceae bacterium]|jgi:hypothetical protein|nr:hypothetical protein [Syntrophorhabdaceae bacterium]